jgi:hypothetical protein
MIMQSTAAALEPSFGDGNRSIGRIVSVTGAKAIVLLDGRDGAGPAPGQRR